MGGVLVNGCGYADNMTPRLGLGQFFCSHCKSTQEFMLMEVKRKVKVIYIPVLTINTRYAVACAKCKNGFYVTDEQRDELQYRNGMLRVSEDGSQISIESAQAAQLPHAAQEAPAAHEEQAEKTAREPAALPEPPAQTGGQAAAGRVCAYCGKPLDADADFCPYCGSLASKEAAAKRVCKGCGRELAEGARFCTRCGTKWEG